MLRPVIGAVFLAGLIAGAASAKDKITWIVNPISPSFPLEPDMMGHGTGDQQLDVIFRHLPGYDHEKIFAPYDRIFREIGTKDGVCTTAVFRNPEREQVARFSNRPFFVNGYRLIVRNADLAKFKPAMTEQGSIDLAALARLEKLHGSYVAGRSMPPILRDFADALTGRKQIVTMHWTPQILQSLDKGRLDFLIGLSFEVNYYADRLKIAKDLAHLKIEGVRDGNALYSACSRGPIGQTVVDGIDRALADEGNWAAFIEPLKPWLSEAEIAKSLAAQQERR